MFLHDAFLLVRMPDLTAILGQYRAPVTPTEVGKTMKALKV
jgi:hypothetical protein